MFYRAHRLTALIVLSVFFSACADDVGKQSQPQSSRTIVNDQLHASTVVFSAPSSSTAEKTAEFVFGNQISSAVFDCQLDGGDIERCTSPRVVKRLEEGDHSFRIYTTFTESKGTVASSDHEIEIDWRIDLTAPSIRIASHPFSNTPSNSATFHLESSEEEARFFCRLNTGTGSPCTNPWVIGNLEAGVHSISIKAVDSVGNVSEAVDFQWTIDPLIDHISEIRGTVVVTDGDTNDLWINAEFLDRDRLKRSVAITDNEGDFVIPNLNPNLEYELWVDGSEIEVSPTYVTQPGHVIHFEITETSHTDLYGCSGAYARYACGEMGVDRFKFSKSTYGPDENDVAIVLEHLASLSCEIECNTPTR